MDYLDVPVIDFSNAYSEKINERFKLAEEIGNVVTNIGFLVLSNHGVNLDVVKKAQQQVSAFFSLPTDKKKNSRLRVNPTIGGTLAWRLETLELH